MRQQAELDDGWLPMDLMLKFVRLKTLAKEASVIVEALEKIGSDLLVLSEDKQKVRRSPSKPYPAHDEAMQLETMKRTVYCKGFPLDETLEPLLAYFSQYGKTDTVQVC